MFIWPRPVPSTRDLDRADRFVADLLLPCCLPAVFVKIFQLPLAYIIDTFINIYVYIFLYVYIYIVYIICMCVCVHINIDIYT